MLLSTAALGARAESLTSTPFDEAEAPWARASRQLFVGATSPPPPSPSQTVSTSAGLTSALANTAVGRIVLASGTYYLTAELSITRSVILEAAAGATVTLNAQASSSSRRRVLNINPGPSGIVQLIRLGITGGYAVRAQIFKSSHRPDGKIADVLARLSLTQLRMLRSTTGGACH
jgi:hypothetical protein